MGARVTSGPDVVVVGAGPNGLAAALVIAQAGLSVRIVEGADTPGGGCRTEELTLAGYHHDVCSTVHPLALASPFFAGLDLRQLGVEFLHPEVCFAQPLADGRAAAVFRSVDRTAEALGDDARAYKKLMAPLVTHATGIVNEVLSPMRRPPRDPIGFGRYGLEALLPATLIAGRFSSDPARALFGGVSAHAMRPLDAPVTGGFGLLLSLLAHAVGWPVVRGGSAGLVAALTGAIEAAGGEIVTGEWVSTLAGLGEPRAILLDVAPEQLIAICGDRLPARYVRALRRFHYGPGVCKVDFALSGPVPWRAEGCRVAGTVHVGGTFEEVAAGEAEVAVGRHPDRPFALVVQPSIIDPDRAPVGAGTLWAYCHVPAGSDVDMADRIQAQIERFAPGFSDVVVARATRTARGVEQHNPNYVGGDINAGAATLRQTLMRPVTAWNPYRTPIDGVYLCSSSTPPGGGVHGMCGTNAARVVLRDVFGRGRFGGRRSPFETLLPAVDEQG
jgi:phytoene dehydrogenase-like protein